MWLQSSIKITAARNLFTDTR